MAEHDGTLSQIIAPSYPEGAVGTLMEQRDQAKANADANRAVSADSLERAAESDARAAQFQAAIDALGGEPTT